MQDELIKNLTETIARQNELILQLQQTIVELKLDNAALRKLIFNKKSEKIEPMEKEVRRKSKKTKQQKQQEAQDKRAKRRDEKAELPEVEVAHEVKKEQLQCPKCGGDDFSELGEGQVSIEYDFIPAKLVRKRHVRQKMACKCGEHIATAPNIERVTEGTHYGPGLHAHVVVQKCADSIPLYRQEKILRRAGISINRSTLKDLFHRCAQLLKPIYDRMKNIIAASEYVNADETTLKMQKKGGCKTGWMWTFIAEPNLLYVFSTSRSGRTPEQVLGNTKGKLQVDGYSGYNKVFTPEGRERVGCLAHARRKFFEALGTEPETARHALDQILELYQVEYKAVELELVGTEAHLDLRKQFSVQMMGRWQEWLEEQSGLHPPNSPMGKAIGYTLKNWTSMIMFLGDPKLSLDNNISERALRTVALRRKSGERASWEKPGSLAVFGRIVRSQRGECPILPDRCFDTCANPSGQRNRRFASTKLGFFVKDKPLIISERSLNKRRCASSGYKKRA